MTNYSAQHRRIFRPGDHALLLDRKKRQYLIVLEEKATFHSHLGTLPHTELIDREPGCWIYTSGGHLILALRPTLADYIQKMPRATQVIYPKDHGAILTLGDIGPGNTVLEAGVGSGALTISLLRAVGPSGRVISYEIRENLIERALRNISAYHPDCNNLTVKIQDIYQGISEPQIDRVVLDLPEPWYTVSHVANALVSGGLLLSFLPTTMQVHQLVTTLESNGHFQYIETVEILLRSWHVTKESMRPNHRMVAHTGFITVARRCDPSPYAQHGQGSDNPNTKAIQD